MVLAVDVAVDQLQAPTTLIVGDGGVDGVGVRVNVEARVHRTIACVMAVLKIDMAAISGVNAEVGDVGVSGTFQAQANGWWQFATQRGLAFHRDRPCGIGRGGGIHLLHPVAVRQ